MYSIEHSCTCGKCKCTSDSIFATAKENGRKLTINNKDGSRICIIKLDGCVYQRGKGPSKCDYVFSFTSADGEQKKVLFVELKGGDVEAAYLQLESSINLYKNDIKDSKKEALVIAKKCPRADDSSAKKKKDYFADKHKTKLYLKTDEYIINHSFT